MDNLKEKTAKGLMWGFFCNSASQVLNLILGIFLARLLSPSDYGIVGVLAIFTAIAVSFQNSGFLQGLVNMKNPQDNDYNSVFWFNIGVSFCIYGILFFAAPLIAHFFHQPCLVEVSRVLFLVLPIYSYGIAYWAFMLKNMMNREIAIIAIFSMVVAGLSAVILAMRGYSYWSLVANQLIYALCFNIGRMHYVRWRPSLRFDVEPIKRLFGFSSKLLITQLFSILNQHLLTFIFGRLFSIHSVGQYTQATKWCNMAKATISGAIGQIAQPVFVSIAKEPEREINVLRKLVRFTSFVTFPAMFGLALVSREFVIIVLGEKWIDCVHMLQILCIGGAFIPLSEIYQNLLISNKRSDLYMWGNIFQASIMLVLALCLFRYGIIAVVCASSLYSILWLFLWQAICCRYIGGYFIDFIKDIAPFVAITALVMGITYFLTYSINNQWLCLISRIVIAIILYLTIMKLAKAKVLDECIDFISKRKKQANVFP